MIDGLFVAVPKNIVDRDKYDPVQLSQFEKVTGIKKTRRWTTSTEDTIKIAINNFKLNEGIGHIDSVIVVTQTPSRLSPCMAMTVVQEMGFPSEVMAFDINQSCTGYIYGLHVAKSLGGRSLLVCIDQLRYSGEGPDDMGALIFSDAISFTVISGYANNSLRCGYKTFARGINKLYCTIEGKMKMSGADVFDIMTKEVPPFIKLATAGFDAEVMVMHQANESMCDLIVRRSEFDGFVPKSINEYGNCSLNSIPVTIAANEEELLDKRCLLVGFGAGFSLAGAALQWSKSKVCQIVEM